MNSTVVKPRCLRGFPQVGCRSIFENVACKVGPDYFLARNERVLAAEVRTPARGVIANELETCVIAFFEDLSQHVAAKAPLIRQLLVRAENALNLLDLRLEVYSIFQLLLLTEIRFVDFNFLDEIDELRVDGHPCAKWATVAEEVLADAAICV